MKQRLLVMNGQKLVQDEKAPGKWETVNVEKAGTLKPAIYNIHQSQQADKAIAHTGIVVHANKEHVFQQVGRQYIQHNRLDFDKVPDIGSVKIISYTAESGKAAIEAPVQAESRGIKR
ncbi:KfrB domain-containing protein [Pseudomonas syringae]|uniref:KfrB domain-containing protein n=1 Tax=Pseudomonas syringae TaxID=317 RepID=UPI00273F22A0|nr:KfrB domain-containing protein [Pseudomonas syringae]MDP5168566.1 conjugal transfer protein TraO [Pseudomonas syringae pv. aptata str. DSM 50252]